MKFSDFIIDTAGHRDPRWNSTKEIEIMFKQSADETTKVLHADRCRTTSCSNERTDRTEMAGLMERDRVPFIAKLVADDGSVAADGSVYIQNKLCHQCIQHSQWTVTQSVNHKQHRKYGITRSI